METKYALVETYWKDIGERVVIVGIGAEVYDTKSKVNRSFQWRWEKTEASCCDPNDYVCPDLDILSYEPDEFMYETIDERNFKTVQVFAIENGEDFSNGVFCHKDGSLYEMEGKDILKELANEIKKNKYLDEKIIVEEFYRNEYKHLMEVFKMKYKGSNPIDYLRLG